MRRFLSSLTSLWVYCPVKSYNLSLHTHDHHKVPFPQSLLHSYNLIYSSLQPPLPPLNFLHSHNLAPSTFSLFYYRPQNFLTLTTFHPLTSTTFHHQTRKSLTLTTSHPSTTTTLHPQKRINSCSVALTCDLASYTA